MSNIKIVDFLPYASNTRNLNDALKRRILIFAFLIHQEIIESIVDFYERQDYLQFDAHVGENLCQIRACQLLELIEETRRKHTPKFEYFEQIALFHEKKALAHKFIQEETNSQEYVSNRNETVFTFLESRNLNTIIPKDLHFLTLSHFLTKFRYFSEVENSVIHYQNMIDRLEMSKNFCRRLVHQYQKQLSENSCRYVLDLALACNELLPSLLQLLYYRDDDDRHVLPSYLLMDVLLRRLHHLGKNILLIARCQSIQKTRIISLFFSPNSRKYQFDFLESPTEKMLHNPCLIIYGIVNQGSNFMREEDYIQQFKRHGLIDIVMANMAAHPQYSGRTLSALKFNPYLPLISATDPIISDAALALEKKFMKFKKIASEIGCTAEQPRLFFIRHILCDTPNRQMDRAQKGKFYSDEP